MNCDTCHREHPRRDFDLGDGQFSSTCSSCVHGQSRTEDRDSRDSRAQRQVQIAALEQERRSLIAALVKIDAKIAELRMRPLPPPIEIAEPVFGEDEISDVDIA